MYFWAKIRPNLVIIKMTESLKTIKDQFWEEKRTAELTKQTPAKSLFYVKISLLALFDWVELSGANTVGTPNKGQLILEKKLVPKFGNFLIKFFGVFEE